MKKIISLALVIITLFSVLSITASAASYSKGTYSVSASSGVNVRSGAGTNYSKVGAAKKNTTFNVSKVSGSWGYTSSIKCTNGYKSGWISLNNCKYMGTNNSSRSTYNDVFASVKGSGYSLSQGRNSQATTFNKGTFVYVWAYLHDGNNNLYKSYGSGICNMTLSIYRPDGSCAHTYTYKNSDNNWIGCRVDRAGTWKIQSKITGSLTGTNTRTITVKETAPKYYTLTYNANGGSNAPASQKVKENTGFYLSNSKPTRSGYTFLGWSKDKYATSASYSPGAGVKTSSNITLYAVWKKNVTKTYWKTGYFDSGYTAKGYTTVTLDNKSSNAYIYVYTYDQFGYKTSGKVHITLRDKYGNWLCEFDASSGDRLKLGNDHDQYRVYIAKKKYPDTTIGNGDDFINVGKCYTWGINCKTNCYTS